MKDEPAQLELRIASRDEATVSEIEAALRSVDAKRWPTSRMDPVTILTLAAAAVKLVSALLELKAKLVAQKNPSDVTMENAAGATLNLLSATEPAIREFVTGSQG